jgi:hypothetical protein
MSHAPEHQDAAIDPASPARVKPHFLDGQPFGGASLKP